MAVDAVIGNEVHEVLRPGEPARPAAAVPFEDVREQPVVTAADDPQFGAVGCLRQRRRPFPELLEELRVAWGVVEFFLGSVRVTIFSPS